MTAEAQPFWKSFRPRRRSRQRDRADEAAPAAASAPSFDIAPNDPAVAYFQSAPGVIDIADLQLESPAVRAMKEANVRLVVPLVSQGELIGLLNLGPRLSEQEYSSDDRSLLNNLAAQATPAVRVAQLVREQQAEAQERERIEQELRVARLIQHTLLPKAVPDLPGWEVGAYYQPAREVGGDFYDFIDLENGKLGFVVGDVTDKGVPAALVMATTRTMIRASASRLNSPGEVLERVNDVLSPDIPPNMFVTCLYAILDPKTGCLRYANAGHDLPYQSHGDQALELRATGMPLGLMPGMKYEERDTVLDPDDTVLFYSDGIVEAHNPQREMFSFGRLRELVGRFRGGNPEALVDSLLGELHAFTGSQWEQEDDITMVVLRRSAGAAAPSSGAPAAAVPSGDGDVLRRFQVASAPGNERSAMRQVREVVEPLGLNERALQRLETAVAEATMNAMEHGNKYQADVPVEITVGADENQVRVYIVDQGGVPEGVESETPDLEAKLASQQTPRGWGLFLIKNMVDEMHVTGDNHIHRVELIVNRGGES